MDKHTPTPWHRNVSIKQPIYSESGPERFVYVAHVLTNEADLDLIVRAVNTHDEMLAALKAVIRYPTLQSEYHLNCFRVSRREGTVEAIQIAQENAKKQREEMDSIMRGVAQAIAKAEGE